MHRLAPHFRDKSHIIWDWNGTLLDDVDLCHEIIGDIAERHGLERPTMTRYLKEFRFPVVEYYKDVGFDFERVSFADLSEQFHQAYRTGVPHTTLHAGTRDLLDELDTAGIKSSVLSAAHETDLHAMLRHQRIDTYFAKVFGLGDIYAVSKIERGRQLLAALDLAPETLMLVGDTDHDLEVGRALGIDVLLVDGGHQHVDRLAAEHHRVVQRT